MITAKLPRGTVKLLVQFDAGQAIGQNAVDWAVSALQDGYDSQTLAVLAGLDLGDVPTAFETRELVAESLVELGFEVPESEELSYLYVVEVASAIIGGELSPQEGAERIHCSVVSPLGHPPQLMPWCNVWEGHSADFSRYSLEDHELDAEILALAKRYVREYA